MPVPSPMKTRRVIDEPLPAALNGQRIDRIVAIVADISRGVSRALIVDGGVKVDGAVVRKPSIPVSEGSVVSFAVDIVTATPQPDPEVKFEVVYHDDHVAIVNKPAGLIVHHGSGVNSGTLVDGLLHRFPQIANVGPTERPGVVHRLDKGTSGLLMVALTEQALENLSGQLADRVVQRIYHALVMGLVEAESGEIDAPLGRSPRQPTRRAVVADGRPSLTRYEVVERYPSEDGSEPVTYLNCQLETGRTHQIRVHMAAIGHPLVGDPTYGGGKIVKPATSQPCSQAVELDRPFLHAATLGFAHPEDGRLMQFSEPLPLDLQHCLAQLDRDEHA